MMKIVLIPALAVASLVAGFSVAAQAQVRTTCALGDARCRADAQRLQPTTRTPGTQVLRQGRNTVTLPDARQRRDRPGLGISPPARCDNGVVVSGGATRVVPNC